MKNIIYLFLFIVTFGSCNNTTEEVREQPSITNTKNVETLPVLSVQTVEDLFENVDYIDLIFLNYSQTISQSEKGTVQNMVRQITDAPQPNIDCAMPFCKVIFYKMPNKLLEGDIHYGNGCAYFVFRDKNGKPQYANILGNSGVVFFNDIITKLNNATK